MTYTMDRANRKLLITCDSCKRGLDYAYGWKGDGTFEDFKKWCEKDFAEVHKCPPKVEPTSDLPSIIFWTIIILGAIILMFLR